MKYEEILEFFISWFRQAPPAEFAAWTWDSRRSMSVRGEGEGFRRRMVAAYSRLSEQMSDNGVQVVMFTHQSGTIWADMANIVWASNLRVTAAWYVVTETESALRGGGHVKGTVLLVLRKRNDKFRTTRDDLGWELKDEVEEQVEALVGLNQAKRQLNLGESLFGDADLQMAGYAAALRSLTKYAFIDGKDMAAEAIRPRVKGQTTFVDELIEYAVGVANEALVPEGIDKGRWGKLLPAERFYLKMIDLEAKGAKTLDNYQNFAKAFKVRDYQTLMSSKKANSARLKGAVELGRSEMSDASELADSPLRAVLYGLMELMGEVDGGVVLTHLGHNVPNFYDGMTRDLLIAITDYLASKLPGIREDEAAAARILRELLRNQRL